MALSTLYITAPAAISAAMGVYFFGRNHPNIKEAGNGLPAPITGLMAKMKKEMKTGETPKLAPQFDGLFCFETITSH